ncbi:MAG: hypothetical protein PHP83_01670 [Clostridia bacterium]|nr:hypothetical protein [Clostridia bacterium]
MVTNNDMRYFNYHAKAFNLINEGHLMSATLVDKHRNISPALVLYFDNHAPMPIRQYVWDRYFEQINAQKVKIIDNRQVMQKNDPANENITEKPKNN